MIVDERLTTYIDSLNWQIPEYLKEVEKEALEKEVPVIRRSMQSLLCFLLRTRKPKAILEIGTAVGFSYASERGKAEFSKVWKDRGHSFI